MALSCSEKCAKGVVITFNLLFWVSGCALLVLGVCIFVESYKVHLFYLVASDGTPRDGLYYLGYVFVIVASVIFVVGFFGCCGSLQESRCLLVSYFVFLFLLLCMELAIAMAAVVYREEFLSQLDKRLLNKLVHNYGHDSTNNYYFTESIDAMQYKFACCGIHSDQDYMNSKWKNDTDATSQPRKVPATCCTRNYPEVPHAGSPISVVSRVFGGTVEEPWQHPQPRDVSACQTNEPDARYTEGCITKLKDWLKYESTIIIAVGIGIGAFQVLGMIFTICLCRKLRDDV